MNYGRLDGTEYPRVRDASAAVAEGAVAVVEVLDSVIGGGGFGLVRNLAGSTTFVGVKGSDGKYPTIASLGQVSSGDSSNPDRLIFTKAIYNFETAGGLENLTLRGAEINANDGNNAAAIRINSGVSHFLGRNFRCIGNQNGILTGGDSEQVLEFEDYVLDDNGFGRNGYTHNAYFGESKSVTCRRGEHLNCRFGHDFKSRSLHTTMEQMRIEGSHEGRAFDMSNGGIWTSSNSAYIKHADATQNNLIHIAAEGIPDGRPERYESTNDLFQIDIPNEGRALQFINNGGTVECVLTDPLFKLGGNTITADEARPFLIGNIRVVFTGGPLGPTKPYGCAGDIRGDGTGSAPAPVVTPAPVPAPAPAPAPADSAWVRIGNENDTITINPTDVIRYGAMGLFVQRVAGVTSFVANNTFFGSDPILGAAKYVEKQVLVAIPVPAPVPAPVPVLTPAPTPVQSASITSGLNILIPSGKYSLIVDSPGGVLKSMTLTAI